MKGVNMDRQGRVLLELGAGGAMKGGLSVMPLVTNNARE